MATTEQVQDKLFHEGALYYATEKQLNAWLDSTSVEDLCSYVVEHVNEFFDQDNQHVNLSDLDQVVTDCVEGELLIDDLVDDNLDNNDLEWRLFPELISGHDRTPRQAIRYLVVSDIQSAVQDAICDIVVAEGDVVAIW